MCNLPPVWKIFMCRGCYREGTTVCFCVSCNSYLQHDQSFFMLVGVLVYLVFSSFHFKE